MIILGIDSSSLVASVAIVADDQLIAEYTVNYKKTHSQTLLPMFDQVARMVELDLHTIDGIAVAGGPGSFTGLRIGTATAKGLGLALEKPLIHVPTLYALAYTMWGSNMLLCPMMDARRNQVYTGLYHCHSGLEVVKPQWAGDVEELVEELNEMGRQVLFLGDGVPVYRQQLMNGLKVPYEFAPAHRNRQSAAAVAALGGEYFKQGKWVSASGFQPDYLRKSQAEREREERQQEHE